MEDSFEALINSYIETNVGIATNFLPDILASNLTEHLSIKSTISFTFKY